MEALEMRRLLPILIPAGVLLLAWQLGIFGKLVSALRSGTDAMTGKTAVDVARDARRDLVQSNLQHAMRLYRATNEQEPADLQALLDAGVLRRSDLVDEWNRPLRSETEEGRLIVRGLGPDARRGTEDDWTLPL
jgi:hypothetical protein